MAKTLQIIAMSVIVATCSVTQAQSSGGARVIYNPQAYVVGGTHAPYANGIVGGEVYIAAHGENAAVMAAGIIDRARGDNIAALQIATMAGQARQPVVVCVPGSRCNAGYCVTLQQTAPPAPVFINRTTPNLPGPPAPIIMMSPSAPVFAPVVSTPHISTTYATSTMSTPTPVYAPAVVYPPVAPATPVFAPTVVSPVAPTTVVPPLVASPPAPVFGPAVPGVPTPAPAITPVPATGLPPGVTPPPGAALPPPGWIPPPGWTPPAGWVRGGAPAPTPCTPPPASV